MAACGGVRWQHVVAAAANFSKIFFFKFCNTMICCLGCANDGVAAMVVVAAVVVAEKFQKFSKIFNFFFNLITSQCCSAGGGTVLAQLR